MPVVLAADVMKFVVREAVLVVVGSMAVIVMGMGAWLGRQLVLCADDAGIVLKSTILQPPPRA